MENVENWHHHSGTLLVEKNNFKVINCNSCGFKHIIPIPTEEELDNIYKEQYYTVEKPLYIERMKEDAEWWEITYTDRYKTFEEQLGNKKGKILDVGSGTGYFLKTGKDRGWNTLGIEPSKQAAEYSRDELKLKIIENQLTEKNYKEFGTFDVIHLSLVLEHIPDPIKMLKIIFEMLNPGGLICVVVPNDFNPFQNVLSKYDNYPKWWVSPPHHINYFDFSSLKKLVQNCGFNVYLEESTFPIDIFLLMGDNYIGNDDLGRACHNKRMRLETLLSKDISNELKRKMYQNFAQLGIGREVIIYAKKD